MIPLFAVDLRVVNDGSGRPVPGLAGFRGSGDEMRDHPESDRVTRSISGAFRRGWWPGTVARVTVGLVEFTDPACSYAWGTEPKVRRLRWQYGHRLCWRRVVVGMHGPGWADGWSEPPSPESLSDYWKGVGAVTGMPFPAPLHHVHASTEDACRLVKAAERQDGAAATGGPADRLSDRLLRLLRESWYVWGDPADTVERGLALAATVDGLDVGLLARDVGSVAVDAAFRADLAEARRPNEYVLNKPDKRVGYGAAQPTEDGMRFGLPCMVLTGSGGEVTVSGWTDWTEWAAGLEAASPGITAQARPVPTPAEAFTTWPLLTRPELEILCGPGHELPPGVV